MFQRFSSLPVLVALIGSLVAIPATSALAQSSSNKNTNRLAVPVTGTVATPGDFAGTFSIGRFDIQNEKLVAIGQLVGTVTDSNGAGRTVVSTVALPVSKAPAGAAACSDDVSGSMQQCDVLNLVLGPLNLDLLGLVIQLDTVVLDIFAVPGAGNLLGNLLCAITGLLDANSIGQQIVNLLNQLIGVLAGL